jgi:hypothetical protein
LQQDGGFLHLPPPIKLTATIKLKYFWKFLPYNFWFIFNRSIIWKTVKYIDQSNTSCQRVYSFDTQWFSRLIANWRVESFNPDVTLHGNIVRCVGMARQKWRKKDTTNIKF